MPGTPNQARAFLQSQGITPDYYACETYPVEKVVTVVEDLLARLSATPAPAPLPSIVGAAATSVSGGADKLADAEIAELRRLAADATGLPWMLGHWRNGDGPWMPLVTPTTYGAPVCRFDRPGAPRKDAADAAYLVAACNALPSLLAQLAEDKLELGGLSQLSQNQAKILSATAIALRGPEPPLMMWSHHDVAELAQKLVDENTKLRAALAAAPASVTSPVEPAGAAAASIGGGGQDIEKQFVDATIEFYQHKVGWVYNPGGIAEDLLKFLRTKGLDISPAAASSPVGGPADVIKVLEAASVLLAEETEHGVSDWSMAESWAFNKLREALAPFQNKAGSELNLSKAGSALPVGVQTGEVGSWISVAERLPERTLTHRHTGHKVSEMMLVAQGKNVLTEPHYMRSDNEWFAGSFATAGITHWQPLPAPPSL